MFFQNIDKWSKKLLWSVTIICYALYFGLVVLAPAITVMCKYHIFEKTEGFQNVTGLGLVVIVIVGIASYCFIKKAISKLPQDSIQQQRFKFSIELIFDCMPLGIALFSIFAIKDDIDLAFYTMRICLFLFLAGVLWNGLFIKFLDAEWDIRKGATRKQEENKRIQNGVI